MDGRNEEAALTELPALSAEAFFKNTAVCSGDCRIRRPVVQINGLDKEDFFKILGWAGLVLIDPSLCGNRPV